ncbi:MAG: polyprenyl synthetase family protein [Pirellulales bacterium]|nr:polyprenyl synthetase family protein [Pirellulales bacterium]
MLWYDGELIWTSADEPGAIATDKRHGPSGRPRRLLARRVHLGYLYGRLGRARLDGTCTHGCGNEPNLPMIRGDSLATVIPASNSAKLQPPLAAKQEGRSRMVPALPTDRYAQLMQAAAAMFAPDEIARLAPRAHRGQSLAQRNGDGLHGIDPLAATETIAYDFLVKGGKHSRPFITLAVYESLAGGHETSLNGHADAAGYLAALPLGVKRCALSIETFHKASLVHDDIEDDDEFRYGDQTLHRKFGTPTAINVGDYLIGLGYRLVARETKSLGPEVVGDILDRLSEAHVKLSEGQGAELIWRDSLDKQLTPQDAIRIYSLKTAPAFEAALHTGLRLAGPAARYAEAVASFATNLGIAFQIINDLNDWLGDDHNKLSAAGDVIGGRPTVLWALALESLPAEQRARLKSLASQQPLTHGAVLEIRRLYDEADVFANASGLVEKYQHRAATVADSIEPEPLRQLFRHLIELVLQRRKANG